MSVIGEPSAVIPGWEATVLAVVLRDYQRRRGFGRLPADELALVDRAIGDLEEAGRRWRAGMSTRGQERSDSAPTPGVVQIGLCAPPALLTTGEVAETLGVSVSTVKRRRVDGKTGGLPAVKVGSRSVRFRRSDVDELVKGRSNGSK